MMDATHVPSNSAPSMLSIAAAASSAFSKWTNPKPRVVSWKNEESREGRRRCGDEIR